MDKKERNKNIWAFLIVGFLCLTSVYTYLISEYYIYLIAYVWFGFIFGMTMQYGRFCFASAFRDLFAVGVPRMVVGIMISILCFSLIASFLTAFGTTTFFPAPFGFYQIPGGFIFGVGMVLAGGCATGSMYKAGEGSGASLLAVLALGASLAIFVDIGGWFNNFVPKSWANSATLKGLPSSINVNDGWMDQFLAGFIWDKPDLTFATMLGLKDASFSGAFIGDFLLGFLIPATLFLVIVYYFWSRKNYLRKVQKVKGDATTYRDEIKGFWEMLTASKRTTIAAVILGVACGLQIFVLYGLRLKFGIQNAAEILQKTGWNEGFSLNATIFDPGLFVGSTQLGQWAAWLLSQIGWDISDNVFFGYSNGIPNPLVNPAGLMAFALIVGAAVMALLNNEFRIKIPTWELATWAILGGILMGIGSRIGLGCNIGAFFIRTAHGDPNGWLFGFGMLAGAYLGVKFFNWWTERQMAKEMAALEI